MKCANCNWQDCGNERLTEMYRLLDHSAHYVDQTVGRGHITGLTHALRCAALAQFHLFRREAQFVALVHDLARPLNDIHHGEVMAEMVRDRVSPEAYEVLRTHGLFQSSIVHSTPPPVLSSQNAQVYAMQLADAERASFSIGWRGRAMKLPEARALIAEYLS